MAENVITAEKKATLWRSLAIVLGIACFLLLMGFFWQWRVIYEVDEWNQVQNQASGLWKQGMPLEDIEEDLAAWGFAVDTDSVASGIELKSAQKEYNFFGYPMGGWGRVVYRVKDGKLWDVRTAIHMKTL